MVDMANLKEQLKEYGITNEKELDSALKRNLAELDIGIMTSPIAKELKEKIENRCAEIALPHLIKNEAKNTA